MLPANHRKKSKLYEQIKLAVIVTLLFCLIGLVGHMDFQDEQMKASIIEAE